jgi:hypothetical protein
MEYKGNYWLTNSQMVKYQRMLCENPCIWLEVVKIIAHPQCDCLEVMDEVFS